MFLATTVPAPSAPALIVFLLVFARVGGALAAAPIFSDSRVPIQAKLGLSAIFAIILTPAQMQHVDALSADPFAFAILLGQQILLGLAFALVFTVIYRAAEMAGEIIGQQIGVTLAETRQGNDDSLHSIGQLYNIIAGLLFLGLDGQHWILLGLGNSLTSMPVTRVFLSPALVDALMPLGGAAIEFGLGLALPLMATLLLADVITGLLGRALPSLNFFILGLPLKLALGLAALLLAAPFMVAVCLQILGQIPYLALWH